MSGVLQPPGDLGLDFEHIEEVVEPVGGEEGTGEW